MRSESKNGKAPLWAAFSGSSSLLRARRQHHSPNRRLAVRTSIPLRGGGKRSLNLKWACPMKW